MSPRNLSHLCRRMAVECFDLWILAMLVSLWLHILASRLLP